MNFPEPYARSRSWIRRLIRLDAAILASLLTCGLTGCHGAPFASGQPHVESFSSARTFHFSGPEQLAIEKLSSYWNRHPLLFVGEVHGTQQAPAVIGELLRAQSASVSVLLGLEIESGEQERIDTFLASSGDAQAVGSLLRGGIWQTHDGRSSEAMLMLLDTVRRLRALGRPISIVCFSRAPRDVDRDVAMADYLRQTIGSHPNARLVALAGNYHTQLRSDPDRPQGSMIWNLRDLAPASINVSAPVGTMWNCASECGPHAFGPRDHADPPSLRLQEGIDAYGYSGTLVLSHFSAAPPASTVVR